MKVCYDKLWKLLIDKKMKKTDLIREAKIFSHVLPIYPIRSTIIKSCSGPGCKGRSIHFQRVQV